MSSKENHWFPLAQYQETRGWRGGSAAALKVQPPLATGVVQRERKELFFSRGRTAVASSKQFPQPFERTTSAGSSVSIRLWWSHSCDGSRQSRSCRSSSCSRRPPPASSPRRRIVLLRLPFFDWRWTTPFLQSHSRQSQEKEIIIIIVSIFQRPIGRIIFGRKRNKSVNLERIDGLDGHRRVFAIIVLAPFFHLHTEAVVRH